MIVRGSNYLQPKSRRAIIPSSRHPVILVVVLLAGCDLSGKPDAIDAYKRPDKIVNFDFLYQRNCAGCHGADGKLGPAPPLNDALFAALVTDAELKQVISEGRRGTPMSAYLEDNGGTLTATQVEILANGIKKRWGMQPAPANAPSLRAGDTGGNALRGAIVYAHACASCHADQGQGTTAAGALNDPAFLTLISDAALRRYIITGRPDLGMPNYAEHTGRAADFVALNDSDVIDLVTFLKSWRTSTLPLRSGEAKKD